VERGKVRERVKRGVPRKRAKKAFPKPRNADFTFFDKSYNKILENHLSYYIILVL
jgi:hypothetical protein